MLLAHSRKLVFEGPTLQDSGDLVNRSEWTQAYQYVFAEREALNPDPWTYTVNAIDDPLTAYQGAIQTYTDHCRCLQGSDLSTARTYEINRVQDCADDYQFWNDQVERVKEAFGIVPFVTPLYSEAGLEITQHGVPALLSRDVSSRSAPSSGVPGLGALSTTGWRPPVPLYSQWGLPAPSGSGESSTSRGSKRIKLEIEEDEDEE